ncbi:hypothetical protein KIPB_004355 [Kipferlia bialata]|uniref:Uncharacterized protein n=1 Tax=Kipferlia bialata TaxID=797122 RepID=A0A9K3GHR6_9EUKA|nr:hypothetical protein KIPB_004355 [Kipferlia bialata]|eukprot:g4355.t1
MCVTQSTLEIPYNHSVPLVVAPRMQPCTEESFPLYELKIGDLVVVKGQVLEVHHLFWCGPCYGRVCRRRGSPAPPPHLARLRPRAYLTGKDWLTGEVVKPERAITVNSTNSEIHMAVCEETEYEVLYAESDTDYVVCLNAEGEEAEIQMPSTTYSSVHHREVIEVGLAQGHRVLITVQRCNKQERVCSCRVVYDQ